MSKWNYNVKEAPKFAKVWLSLEGDDGRVYVTRDRVALWMDKVYAWKPYKMPEPAPIAGAKTLEQRHREWYGLGIDEDINDGLCV